MTNGSSTSMRTNLLAAAVAVVVMAVAFLAFAGGSDDVDLALPGNTASTAVVAESSTSTTTSLTTSPPTTVVENFSTRFSDLPAVSVNDLPTEAIETLFLIADGGPYPYRQDDGTFQNREGILPDRDQAHYREYTVDTPGSPDRGARRIVSGADGERYYTDDHYDSFREIVE